VRESSLKEKEQTKEIGDRVCHVNPSGLWGCEQQVAGRRRKDLLGKINYADYGLSQ